MQKWPQFVPVERSLAGERTSHDRLLSEMALANGGETQDFDLIRWPLARCRSPRDGRKGSRSLSLGLVGYPIW